MEYPAVYKTGCGQSFFSDHALEEAGPELRHYGKRIFLVAGEKAFAAAGPRLIASLKKEGLAYERYPFQGECSWNQIDRMTEAAGAYGAQVLLAVGGGKCIDASKVAADRLGLPIAVVPTVAATCASYVPGSIVYTEEGRPDGGAANKYENVCIFLDTEVLRKAPPRYLAAGMADALAKYYELYAAGTAAWERFQAGEGYDSAIMSAFDLSRTTRAILERNGISAYRENERQECGRDLCDLIFLSVVLTGVISGLSGGNGQLQIAHHFHNALKELYPEQMHRYLHGELVGTGILVQMVYNGNTPEEIEAVRQWMRDLRIPVKVEEYGVRLSQEQVDFITAALVAILPIGRREENRRSIRTALNEVL